MSRSPASEAIIRLAGDKLAHNEPRLVTVSVEVRRKDPIGLYEIREALEGLAARLVAVAIESQSIGKPKQPLHDHRHVVIHGNSYEHMGPDLPFLRQMRITADHSALDYLLDNIGYRVRLAMLRIAFTPAPHLAVDGSKSIYIAIPSRYPYSAEKEDRSRIARLRQTLMNKNFSTNHTGGR